VSRVRREHWLDEAAATQTRSFFSEGAKSSPPRERLRESEHFFQGKVSNGARKGEMHQTHDLPYGRLIVLMNHHVSYVRKIYGRERYQRSPGQSLRPNVGRDFGCDAHTRSANPFRRGVFRLSRRSYDRRRSKDSRKSEF